VRDGLDWSRNGTLAEGTVPWSCCRRANGTELPCEAAPTNANSFLSVGCLAAAKQLLTEEGWVVGGATIGVTALLLASTIAGCCLARPKRSPVYEAVPQKTYSRWSW